MIFLISASWVASIIGVEPHLKRTQLKLGTGALHL
jgi:hypothetical protein